MYKSRLVSQAKQRGEDLAGAVEVKVKANRTAGSSLQAVDIIVSGLHQLTIVQSMLGVSACAGRVRVELQDFASALLWRDLNVPRSLNLSGYRLAVIMLTAKDLQGIPLPWYCSLHVCQRLWLLPYITTSLGTTFGGI